MLKIYGLEIFVSGISWWCSAKLGASANYLFIGRKFVLDFELGEGWIIFEFSLKNCKKLKRIQECYAYHHKGE